MKKRLFKTAALILGVAAMCTALAGCDKNKDDSAKDTPVASEIYYSVDVSKDYLKFFDVKVTYSLNSVDFTDLMYLENWSHTLDFTADVAFIRDHALLVVATPKSPAVEPEAGKTYSFGYNASACIKVFNADNELLDDISPRPFNQTGDEGALGGEALAEFLAKTHTLLEYSTKIGW